ncbi:MAG: DNA primase [Methylocystis sp.]|nr:MAG: DNA primase [Methylocystis sp.]
MVADQAWREWIDEARRVRVASFCAARGIKLRPGDQGQPCPGCGGRDRFSVNLKKNVWNCRVSGFSGDAIALAQHLDGGDFVAACEAVTGRLPPGRDVAETQEQRAEREAGLAAREQARIAEEARQARVAAEYREAERRRAWGFWKRSLPLVGTPAQAYLEKRRIRAHETARLRFAPDMELWTKPGGVIARRGPAMIAAIEGCEGRFTGVHVTWIDLEQPKGKAETIDPETGLILPAKKVRGSLKGGSIRLVSGGECPKRWFLGEGIETVFSVYWSLVEAGSPLVEGAEFRSGVDLDNLGGKAAGRLRHPTKTFVDARGRVRPVIVRDDTPVEIERDWQVIYIPASVQELYLLGDGDSDPFTTRLALRRAARRFSRAYPSLAIMLAMSRDGVDFSDMRMGDVASGCAGAERATREASA